MLGLWPTTGAMTIETIKDEELEYSNRPSEIAMTEQELAPSAEDGYQQFSHLVRPAPKEKEDQIYDVPNV